MKRIDIKSDINLDYATEMNYPWADKLIVKIHWWSFGGLALFAFLAAVVKIANYYPSPLSWRVMSPAEALGALVLGLLSSALVTLAHGKINNHYYWRLLVTSTLTIYAYLMVFIAGGAIEMHFIFFAMITLVLIYSDWRLGWLMLVLVALHHGILNYIAPFWVYQYGRNDLALFAHSWPVLIAVIFTTILANNNRRSVRQLKDARSSLEKKVQARTAELRKSNQRITNILQGILDEGPTRRSRKTEKETF
ncbi:MAG TPA: hypothetical protein VNA68_01315 [Candidatus Dormibacteraeota bacterium]|nr:hypothetical protein [Candidatus Dormibacteraeota bacterium]